EEAVIEDADAGLGRGPEGAAHVDDGAARVDGQVIRYNGTGFVRHSEAIMPKTAIRQADQSVNGLFRMLGVDARSLPRTRRLYRPPVTGREGRAARGAV